MYEPAVIHEALNLLRGIWKGVEKEWQTYARQLNLTPAQQHILWNLAFEEGITISALSARSLMHITTTTDVVKRMEGRGLVRVENCPHDGRAYLVFLTDTGRQLWQQSLDSTEAWPLLGQVLNLDPEERQLLMRILREWAGRLQDEAYCDWVKGTTERIESMAGK